MSIAVVQLGARMHYAVPRILYDAGALERLYTDICGTKGWPSYLRLLPRALQSNRVRKVLDRNPEGIPADRIVAYPSVGIRYAMRLRQAGSSTADEAFAHLAVARVISRDTSNTN